MVRPIMKDILFLGQKSEEATEKDRQVIADLRDTLAAHREACVGMAANMIGSKKRIIIVSLGFADLVMINPVIIQKSQPYEAEESCLSLTGVRKTTRFGKIKVRYQDESFQKHTQAYEDILPRLSSMSATIWKGLLSDRSALYIQGHLSAAVKVE